MYELLTDPRTWESLAALTLLEIVLGVDNILFLSIVSGQLPKVQQPRARGLGLAIALIMRILLLTGIAWVMSLSEPFVTILNEDISWRDVILGGGGLFLIYKGTTEIHLLMAGEEEFEHKLVRSFMAVIIQIGLFDLVFSLDSVITAVGMAEHLSVMIAAIVLAMIVMFAASGPVSKFIEENPSVKMLGLSFLLLIGIALLADAAHFHIPRGYLYFAVAFSALVEAFNQFASRNKKKKKNR
ncbi:MAG TPA: TerC family protein [Rhizomicrobium sp.]|jgi:predicted tellurium resistance membrane protein TerC